MRQSTRIEVTVDGHPVIIKDQRVSPWGTTMTAAKGATVKLVATVWVSSVDYVDCVIMRNNRSVPRTGFDSRQSPGQVVCTA
jgi:hypothetical protein